MEQMAGGVVLLLAGTALGEIGQFDPAGVTTAALVGLAFLVVFGSLAAFTAYVWLLNHVAVTTVATYAYVNPVVAVGAGRRVPWRDDVAALAAGGRADHRRRGGDGQRAAARGRGDWSRARGGIAGTGRRHGMTPMTVRCEPERRGLLPAR